MGPVDAAKTKKITTPGIRKPVAPASARAYVPFVPPGKTTPFDNVAEESDWIRLCGRVSFTAAGLGAVCLAVVLLTGRRGPAPYLELPLLILGAIVGCVGVALSRKKSMVGWRANGVAILIAVIAMTFGQVVTMMNRAVDARPVSPVIIADHDLIAPPADPIPSPVSDPSPVPVVTQAPVVPVAVSDQTILSRANAMLAAQPGFAYGPGWVAIGRSGLASVALAGLDPAGPQLGALRHALPMNVSMVVISVDNTDGSKPIQIDPEFVKGVTSTGVTVSALSPRLVLSTATQDADLYLKKFGHPISVAAGARLDQAVIFFPGNVDTTKLHGLTFTANGTMMTFRGHIMTKTDKMAMTTAAK